nr:hypothetical protein [Tanacetum cinerariifolium]
MPTKTRSSKRLIRLPVKYNDHVMMNSNQVVDQNRSYEKDHYSGNDRMGIGDLGKEGDENVSPMLNKGVFGYKENDNSMGSDMNVEDENVGDTSGSHKESNCENNIGNEEGIKENMPNKTYAFAVHKNKQSIDTSLEFRPTMTDDEGKMWGKYGFIDVQVDDNGGCFFKFKNEEGMEKVIEQAWTRDDISALASSLGKPLRMDNITAQACQTGRGRATFARVLVEFDVKKGFKDEIGIQYMSKDNIVKGTKVVKVEYQWKPKICSNCMMFGNNVNKCSKMKKTNGAAFNNQKEKDINNESNKENDGFVEIRNRKQDNWRNNMSYVHC